MARARRTPCSLRGDLTPIRMESVDLLWLSVMIGIVLLATRYPDLGWPFPIAMQRSTVGLTI
jgi:hypothetical protein